MRGRRAARRRAARRRAPRRAAPRQRRARRGARARQAHPPAPPAEAARAMKAQRVERPRARAAAVGGGAADRRRAHRRALRVRARGARRACRQRRCTTCGSPPSGCATCSSWSASASATVGEEARASGARAAGGARRDPRLRRDARADRRQPRARAGGLRRAGRALRGPACARVRALRRAVGVRSRPPVCATACSRPRSVHQPPRPWAHNPRLPMSATDTPRAARRRPPRPSSAIPPTTSTASFRGSTSTCACSSSPRIRQVPLLERTKFASIYASNLDEYFMVRVAGLHDQIEAGVERPRSTGARLRRRSRRSTRRVIENGSRLARCVVETLLPALAEHGIVVKRVADISEAQSARRSTRHFRSVIFPALTPLAVGPGPALPLHLEPVAVARRDRPRPRQRPHHLRAREGSDRGPAAVGRARRRDHLRAARGRDRAPPRRALPGHGDRRLRLLPRHPRRRPRDLRRGRRPARRRSRRSCAAGAWARSCASRSAARIAPRLLGELTTALDVVAARRLPGRGHARPDRPAGAGQAAGLRGAARRALHAGRAAAAARRRRAAAPT